MALPKRRKSRARVHTRQAQWKAAPITMTSCAHCDSKILPHRACTECGYYNGRAVMPARGEKATPEVE